MHVSKGKIKHSSLPKILPLLKIIYSVRTFLVALGHFGLGLDDHTLNLFLNVFLPVCLVIN